MLRDGLNLYGAIWLVNTTNMLFWFIIRPTDERDTVKTIVTSMAAVLTTSMTLRIILSVRGPLEYGGSFAHSSALTGSSRTTHIISTRSGAPTHLSIHAPTHTYTLDEMRSKTEGEFESDAKSSVADTKSGNLYENSTKEVPLGVKVTVDREIAL